MEGASGHSSFIQLSNSGLYFPHYAFSRFGQTVLHALTEVIRTHTSFSACVLPENHALYTHARKLIEYRLGKPMYTRSQLEQYPFFKKLLDGRRISDVLDPLTGLVTRAYIIEYVQDLIRQGRPFTFGMIDLDNFKYINDTYGHAAGDAVLQGVASSLISLLDERGVAGRFGGDEFLFINLEATSYFAKKQFCLDMFSNARVFRKTYHAGEFELFVTGTAGLATFPHDASDYDEMFEAIDKTLYRGKSKGRNCYIIYVAAKHKDIVIRELKHRTQYQLIREIADQFDSAFDVHEKMRRIFSAVGDDLHISDMYYAGRDGVMRSIRTGEMTGSAEDIDALMTDDVFTTNQIDTISKLSPVFFRTLKKHSFETVLAVKVRTGRFFYGYLIFAEPHNLRIWQDDEIVIMFSLGRMLAGFMISTGSSLETGTPLPPNQP